MFIQTASAADLIKPTCEINLKNYMFRPKHVIIDKQLLCKMNVYRHLLQTNVSCNFFH